MLKAMLPLSTVLGLFAAVPMSADREPRSLGEALYATVETIEVLRGYQSAPSTATDRELVQRVTEPALGDSQQRVDRLTSLGRELDRLHAHLELLQSGVLPAAAPVARVDESPVRTVGLTDGELERLVANSRRSRISEIVPGEDDAAANASPSDSGRAPVAPPTPIRTPVPATGPDPAANLGDGEIDPDSAAAAEAERAKRNAAELAFAKARAAYFAGRYDRALVEFEALDADPKSKYWRARCLEQLDRLDEALTLYDEVVADPRSGDVARRAQGDADFLRWKVQFENGASDQ